MLRKISSVLKILYWHKTIHNGYLLAATAVEILLIKTLFFLDIKERPEEAPFMT
jgi:hypothetical protein